MVVYSLVSSGFLILAGSRMIVQVYTQEENALGNSPDSQSNIPATTSERRKAPRYTFVATTVLTDITSSQKLSGRVMEISRSGCYVDILYALPVGTQLIVNISCDRGTLVVKGKILYIHEGIGMGVVFLDPPKDQLEILDSWLAELSPPATP
jgi:PilZ domain-containing protein